MKVAMVGNFGLWQKGTMGVRALPMARALVERGCAVTLVVPPWDAPEDSGLEHRLDGVLVANVKLPPRLPLLWHAWLTARVLRRTLAENADVVHIFKPKAYSGLVAIVIWALKKLGLARARLVVDTDDWEGWGGWNELESFPWPVKWFIAWHERWGLRHNDAVTVASRALESLVLGLGVPKTKIHYVPNGWWQANASAPSSVATADVPVRPSGGPAGVGADVSVRPGDGVAAAEGLSISAPSHEPSVHYETLSRELAGSPTVLLYTRFFEFQSSRVVHVFSRVRASVPETRLLVVGQGLHGEECDFLALLRQEGLDQAASLAGWARADHLPRLFSLADVAIYPMDDTLLNRAKCPMKLIDLMASGCSVVAERVGQTAEYIAHGESGLLVAPDNPAEFAEAIVALLKDPARRASLGTRARERILQHFDWRHLVDAVERVYAGAPGPK
ncbi:MAG: glycosyltransferase family 4 protein [Chloroflexi bacterium]|nr:glycosyltransferase family 4 protein [Chloroflexota bacterium]